MKLKKSAVKHLKQKAKKSLKSTGDASAAKQSRPKSRQGSSSRQSQMRRSEQLSHEDTTADSGFIKLKSPANKDSTGKRYIPYSL